MLSRYHRQITTEALSDVFAPQPLQTIITANLRQDWLPHILRPEYHFDNSTFKEGAAYIHAQRGFILDSLRTKTPPAGRIAAWQAFGRITHALQDFYAHSNYLALWAETCAPGLPDPETVHPLIPTILASPRLKSGYAYILAEALGMIPPLAPLIRRLLPPDTHINMNLDAPSRGPLFPHALVAARKRTRLAYDQLADKISRQISPETLQIFIGA